MSSGRSEKRIARMVRVEHGARILTERKLERGQQVLVSAPKEGAHSQARIVYCQRVSEGWFAVGVELSSRLELWAKPY